MSTRTPWIAVLLLAFAACGDAERGDKVVVVDDEPNNSVSDAVDESTADQDADEDEDGEDTMAEPFCGDGVLDPAEACDDGNTTIKDGCSDECEIETVVLRNLEATLDQGDDMTRCGEGTNFPCEANYSISLTLSNFTDLPVDRVTHIRVGFAGITLSTGGTACQERRWQVDPQSTSEIINLGIQFYSNRYTLVWICNRSDQGEWVEEYVEERSYVEGGDVTFEISGLLEDGSVWETSAVTSFKDLR